MWLFLMTMFRAGMLKKEDLAEFSAELRKQLSASLTIVRHEELPRP